MEQSVHIQHSSSSVAETMLEGSIVLWTLGRNNDADQTSDSSGSSSTDDAQDGVRNIEAVAMTWTKWGLIAAYVRYVLV